MVRPVSKDIKLAVAAECLRQIWQNFDSAGHSYGRSRESVWLETAIDLIEYDGRYSNMADELTMEFDELRAETRFKVNKEKSNKHYKEMGLDIL